MYEEEEEEDKLYKTKLVNETDQDVELYFTASPVSRKILPAGEAYVYEGKEEREVFSPYIQVTWQAKYSKEGKKIVVKLKKRPGFKIKYKQNEFPLTWLNLGKLNFEMDSNKNGTFVLQKGIPLVAVNFSFESRAIFKSITIKKPLLIKSPSKFVPGLLKITERQNWEYIKRNPSELLKVKAARDRIRQDAAKAEDKRELNLERDGERRDKDLR